MWAGLKDFSTNKKQSRIKGIKVCPNDLNSCWWLKKLKKHVCLQNKTHSLFYSTNSAWKLKRDPNSLAYNILNLFFYRSLFISIKNGKHTSTISTGNSIGWISIVVSTIVKIKRKCLSQFFFFISTFPYWPTRYRIIKKKKKLVIDGWMVILLSFHMDLKENLLTSPELKLMYATLTLDNKSCGWQDPNGCISHGSSIWYDSNMIFSFVNS